MSKINSLDQDEFVDRAEVDDESPLVADQRAGRGRPLPLVALVGRPNVGKSTLFNRIVGERLAIVEDVAGTTRDRLVAESDWTGHSFAVVDTGGLDMGSSAALTLRIRNQAQLAVEEAQVVVLVVDAREGLTAADEEVAAFLRQSGKAVVLAANKADGANLQADAAEFWPLGLGQPFAVSALHGRGIGDLLDAIVAGFGPSAAAADAVDDAALRIAIVGRPNVGKSSLVNKLLGEERVIVSAEAGTTRDAIDVRLQYEGEDIVLVDTAGIRRRGRIVPGIERYSVMRAERAIERAEVVVLVMDATEGAIAQDAHIAGLAHDLGRGCVIAVNKWDLIDKDTHTVDEYTRVLHEALKFVEYAPIVFISALTGQRVTKVLDLARQVQAARQLRIPTGELNRFVAELQIRHELSRKGRPLKIKYATQVAGSPPTFVFFVNDRELVHFSYERYVENQIRRLQPFVGTPLRLVFKSEDRTKKGRASR